MKTLLAILACILIVPSCFGQMAKISFYSPAMSAKDWLKLGLPAGTESYYGWIFDGNKKLAYIHIGRFATFNLSPGSHIFSSSDHSKPTAKNTLQLDLQDGATYCVRATANFESAIVLPVWFNQGRFKQIPCSDAKQEATKLKPESKKYIDKSELQNWNSSPLFPQ